MLTRHRGRWLLTGSENLSVQALVVQSPAGRTAVLHLLPLSWRKLARFKSHHGTLDEAMLKGGYPRILDKSLKPVDWLAAYGATYLERDGRSLSDSDYLATHITFRLQPWHSNSGKRLVKASKLHFYDTGWCAACWVFLRLSNCAVIRGEDRSFRCGL